MQKSTIRRKIEAHGYVFTELDSGVRVSARGPKFPADSMNDGERPTVVTVKRNGETLERVEKSTQASGAAAFVRRVELAKDVQAYIDAYNAGRIASEEECAAFARQRGYDSLEAFRTATDAYRLHILQGVGVTSS